MKHIKDHKSYSILIIEDNPGDILIVEDYLQERIQNPLITQVNTFHEASQLLLIKKQFDVILLDLTLPDKNGQALINDLHKIAGSIPVIILTGYTDIEFSIYSISFGISDYLLKDDLTATTLYKSILYSIERKRTIAQLEESERRYSQLFLYSPVPMIVFDDTTLKIIQVNHATLEMYGYTRDELLQMTILNIRPPEDIPRTIEVSSKDQDELIMYRGRFRHVKKSGEIILVDIYSSNVMLNEKKYRLVTCVDVTEKVTLEHSITRAIIKTQEDERYEIGSKLHDNVCQILATSQINFAVLKKSLNDSQLEWLNKGREYVALALDEIRNLSHRLAPAFFDETTIEKAFQRLISSVNVDDRFIVKYHYDDAVKNFPVSMELQLNLYRILQEQLKNILKYAKAHTIEVSLTLKDHYLVLVIKDDGIGFNPHQTHPGIGIGNMKRRAELFSGNLEIESATGKGCTVIVEIPLSQMN